MIAGTGIPRIIHQTYPTKYLPERLRDNVASLKNRNPGWKHCLYDDEDIEAFISAEYGPAILNRYRRINPKYGAMRADLFRYLLLYRQGGVYLDIKSSFSRPLDQVLQPADSYILSHWPARLREWGDLWELKAAGTEEFQQCFIICAPGHPFLKAVIENALRNITHYLPSIHGVGKIGVLRVTGPIAYTLAIWSIFERGPYRLVDSENDLGFVYSIYENQTHESLFQNHYSSGTEPVVKLSPGRWLFSESLGIAKTSARHLRNFYRNRVRH